ncbi:ABC transporter permease [Roseburia hominis]
MNIFSKITARTMKLSRTRTIVTIIGVILSTAMITAVATFGTSFQKFLVDFSISRDGDWYVATKQIAGKRADELESREEVQSAAEVKILGFALFEPAREASPEMPYLYVRSLSEQGLAMLPVDLEAGRMPENGEEIVIPSFLQANLKQEERLQIGDALTLELGERSLNGERLGQDMEYVGEGSEEGTETFTPNTTKTFQVVGIYNSWTDVSYWGAGYDVLAGPTEEETGYVDLFLKLKTPRKVYDFVEENLNNPGDVYMYNSSLLRWLGVADNDNLSTVLGGLLAILVGVIMAGSITLIYNAFSISLRERTVQFGLLASIGATKKQLRSSMRYEAFFVSAVGIPLGILSGVGGIGVTLHYIGSALTNWVQGTKKGIPLYVPWWSVLAAAFIAFVTVMISVWIPSRRIRKISPMDAIRANQDIRIRTKEIKTGAWVQRLFGMEGMMAQKNYKRDRRKYRATVVSLTMSIVLFTTAALFNTYLVATGAFVLTAPEIDLEYVIYDDVKGNEGKADEVIRQVDDVTSVYKYYIASFEILIPEEWTESETLSVYTQSVDSVEEGMVPVMTTAIILEDSDFEKFAKEQGVNVRAYDSAEHLPFLYLDQGKVFNTETERYEKTSIFPVKPEGALDSGVIDFGEEGDHSEFVKGQPVELRDAVTSLPETMAGYEGRVLILTKKSLFDKFEDVFEEINVNAKYSIQCENAAETFSKLEKKLNESGLEEAGYLENLTEQYETDKNTMAAVKVLTYGFIVLISLIAVANVFNTISTNLMLRRKEFAMMRSMGMSPKGFRRMMNYECLIYGVRAIIYGVVFTILISLGIRQSIGAGADVEFLIPWGYLAVAVVGVFVVVFLTMLYTMRVIKKNNIVEELKMN